MPTKALTGTVLLRYLALTRAKPRGSTGTITTNIVVGRAADDAGAIRGHVDKIHRMAAATFNDGFDVGLVAAIIDIHGVARPRAEDDGSTFGIMSDDVVGGISASWDVKIDFA